MSERNSTGHEAADHKVTVWRKVNEGSATAECVCGWKGPKRTWVGGLAYDDADDHTWQMQREQAYAPAKVRGEAAR